MTLPNPKFAPRRNDLAWLRRRRVKPAPASTAAAEVAPAEVAPAKVAPAKVAPAPAPQRSPARGGGASPTGGGRIDYTRHDRESPAPAPASASGNSRDLSGPAPTPAPTPVPAPPEVRNDPAPASGNSLDLSSPPSPPPAPPPRPPTPAPPAPASSGDPLDLSSPGPASSGPPRSSPGSTSLDLGGGPAPADPSRTVPTSLDLGAGPSGAPPRSPRAPTPPPAPARHHVVRRTRRGATTLLDFGAPVVMLSPLQSGVGELTVDAVVGDEVGDLRIGAAYALVDGRTGTVELDAGRRHGPESRPVVWAQREGRFERIALDLRRSRSLARLLVYAFSPSRVSVTWGGTVVVTTYGGDRIDAPIVSAPSPAVLALLSVYNVDGEFVVRAEMDPVAGTVRDTCRAFGYDRITWLDDRTPVT